MNLPASRGRAWAIVTVVCWLVIYPGLVQSSPSRTILISNNTNATLFVYRGDYAQPIQVAPLSRRSLLNFLRRGENAIRIAPLCVAGHDLSRGIQRVVWVSGQERRRRELEFFARDFGKRAMFDKPNCRLIKGRGRPPHRDRAPPRRDECDASVYNPYGCRK